MYLWLYIIPLVLVLGAQLLVSGAYNKYKTVKNKKGLTGYDVARQILNDNGLSNIDVIETKGVMTDHYDPARHVIRLSTSVYHDSSIASIAIAAHESGHAIQHKNKYLFIRFRELMFPIVNFASKIGYIVLIIGLFASIFDLALIGIILLCATLLFQLVTLPVEFDASSRAKKILSDTNMIDSTEASKVSSMLTAAAMTYVASLLANLLEILRLVLIVTNRRN